jgi:arabinogalactan oligomer/maltooligosaccharide transport system substrate-binding protein
VTRRAALVLVLVLLPVAFVAQVSARPTAPTTTITIWDGFHDSPRERAALNRVAQEWARATRNSVVNAGDVNDPVNQFKVAARTGRAPDVIQFPHSNLGSIAAHGLLAAPPSGFVSRRIYDAVGVAAVTFEGKLYGLPIARETYFLFYNREFVSSPPRTWRGLIGIAKKLTTDEGSGFLWDTANFYYAYNWIRGFGGYVFKLTPNGFDAKRLGINTSGAIRGLQFLQDLVQRHRLVPATTTSDVAESSFASGKTAMIIGGPWAVAGFRASGVSFGVAPLPRLPNGKPSAPFVGVQVLAVNRYSKKTAAAWSLVRYLSTHLPLPLFRASGRVPVLKAAATARIVQRDAVARATIQSSNNGEALPNIPAMGHVWEPMGHQLQLVVNGKTTPAAAARAAHERIARAIEAQGG